MRKTLAALLAAALVAPTAASGDTALDAIFPGCNKPTDIAGNPHATDILLLWAMFCDLPAPAPPSVPSVPVPATQSTAPVGWRPTTTTLPKAPEYPTSRVPWVERDKLKCPPGETLPSPQRWVQMTTLGSPLEYGIAFHCWWQDHTASPPVWDRNDFCPDSHDFGWGTTYFRFTLTHEGYFTCVEIEKPQ